MVLHPDGMSLVLATLAGVITPNVKLDYWATSYNKLLCTQFGIDSDTYGNLYMGTYSDLYPTNGMWIFKMNPNATYTFQALNYYNRVSTSGKINVVRMAASQTQVIFGGQCSNQAYIFACNQSNLSRVWWLQRQSTTSVSEVLLIDSF